MRRMLHQFARSGGPPVAEPVSGTPRNAECLPRPTLINLPSTVHGEHTLDAVDHFLAVVVAVRRLFLFPWILMEPLHRGGVAPIVPGSSHERNGRSTLSWQAARNNPQQARIRLRKALRPAGVVKTSAFAQPSPVLLNQ